MVHLSGNRYIIEKEEDLLIFEIFITHNSLLLIQWLIKVAQFISIQSIFNIHYCNTFFYFEMVLPSFNFVKVHVHKVSFFLVFPSHLSYMKMFSDNFCYSCRKKCYYTDWRSKTMGRLVGDA